MDKKKILVVDGGTYGGNVSRSLSPSLYETTVVTSGPDAVNLMGNGKCFDAVIMGDIPNGHTFLQIVKELNPNAKTFASTRRPLLNLDFESKGLADKALGQLDLAAREKEIAKACSFSLS